MTNTTPESKPKSVSPLLQSAEQSLRGQEFITAQAVPEGLRLTGRKALLGRVAILTEDDVRRARDIRHQQAHSTGLRDAAMWALIGAPEPSKTELAKLVEAEARTEDRPTIQSFAHLLSGHLDFSAQAQGSGIALFATGSSRSAYLTEMLVNAALRKGGLTELLSKARGALGLDASVPSDRKAPIAHVTVEATLDTSQPLAAVNELSAAVTHLEEKLDSTAGQLGVLLSVIPVVSGAVSAICAEGGTAADHEAAATHLVALVEKARKLALGAE
ncbi:MULTISPECIES: hypothetical protein [Myxococcus]|uniref:hypothetical protein n=1 Tax=Myxococcus TaxID=32 RepID=UPI0011445907|nr:MULTISPECIES: hypothetical protein [Myxococcus]NOK05816.1 hypothetical protein [Myxococcus xanthus]